MKVKAERPRKYMYPDVSIVCGQAQFEDASRCVLINPMVIIEVLSDSTEKHDRGKKFQYYQSIESVQEYVLVAQDMKHIDHYMRQSDNLWLLTSIDDEDSALHLPSIQCMLNIKDIYEKVTFESDADSLVESD